MARSSASKAMVMGSTFSCWRPSKVLDRLPLGNVVVGRYRIGSTDNKMRKCSEREPHIWARFIPFSSRANAHFWQILLKQNRPKPHLKPFERKATRSRYSERKQERIAAISCGIASRPLTTCGLQKGTPSSLWYSGFTQDRCLSIGLLIGRQRRGWGLPLRRLLTSA